MAKSFISPELPKEFLSKHQLLLYFNDLIVDMLEKADEHELSSHKVDFRFEDNISKDTEISLDWLIENGYKDIAFKSTKAHIFFSLLKDFIFYMHESISCSERGKVTVAFSNSRKPIKDNLFYITWLLVDSDDFISKLLYNQPKNFEVSKIGAEFIIQILEEAVDLLDFHLEGALLAEMIYDKKSPKSLTSVWDKSLHVVTTDKRYPTAVGSLNFIFADEKIWDEYWEIYYDKITHIMIFAIEVFTANFEEISKVDKDVKSINKFIRNIKYNLTYSDDFDPKIYKEILKVISFKCKECNHEFMLEREVLDEFINDYLFTCPNCSKIERVGQYYY